MNAHTQYRTYMTLTDGVHPVASDQGTHSLSLSSVTHHFPLHHFPPPAHPSTPVQHASASPAHTYIQASPHTHCPFPGPR
mmetsp:Transcript_23776/g.68365  ORF Transcript_23776/g.68365 Transcript_23776/m.68365 type:complete len:80 (-) Transcript_23776:547-786(-)